MTAKQKKIMEAVGSEDDSEPLAPLTFPREMFRVLFVFIMLVLSPILLFFYALPTLLPETLKASFKKND